jgi:hypothetical protein
VGAAFFCAAVCRLLKQNSRGIVTFCGYIMRGVSAPRSVLPADAEILLSISGYVFLCARGLRCIAQVSGHGLFSLQAEPVRYLFPAPDGHFLLACIYLLTVIT